MLLEQENPESTPFRFLGEKSLASMTREYLDTNVPELLELKNKNPKDFKRLCRLTRHKKNHEQYTKGYWQNTGKITKIVAVYLVVTSPLTFLSYKQLFDGSRFNDSLMSLITHPLFPLKDYGMHLNWDKIEWTLLLTTPPCLLTLFGTFSFYEHLNPGKEIVQQLKENEEELRLIQDKAIIALAVAQNCFNWARRHLRQIGVTLQEDKWIEKFIVIPELYISGEKKYHNRVVMEEVD